MGSLCHRESRGKYHNYRVTKPYSKDDRRRIAKGKKPKHSPTRRARGYSTTYFGKRTAAFIKSAPRKQPILAMYAPYAPHAPFRAPVQHRDTLTNNGWSIGNPSILEEDVSDKPWWIRRKQGLPSIAEWLSRDNHTKQRETLRTVDDEIGRILKALKKSKRLSRTLFMYVSDNGLAHGQHHLTSKYTPHRAATEVPMLVRYGDRLASGRTDYRVTAANIDLAATILKAAKVPERVQGRSLRSNRKRVGVPLTGGQYPTKPPYCGYRTRDEMYVRYGSGEEEYYDYSTDPYELENRVDDPTAADAVARLRSMTVKACSPVPPGFGPNFFEPTWEYPNPPPEESASPTPTGSPTISEDPEPEPEGSPLVEDPTKNTQPDVATLSTTPTASASPNLLPAPPARSEPPADATD